jgi:hypothetical protein
LNPGDWRFKGGSKDLTQLKNVEIGKEELNVGTALVAVRHEVRTGTSPVPTTHLLSPTAFSILPEAQ